MQHLQSNRGVQFSLPWIRRFSRRNCQAASASEVVSSMMVVSPSGVVLYSWHIHSSESHALEGICPSTSEAGRCIAGVWTTSVACTSPNTCSRDTLRGSRESLAVWCLSSSFSKKSVSRLCPSSKSFTGPNSAASTATLALRDPRQELNANVELLLENCTVRNRLPNTTFSVLDSLESVEKHSERSSLPSL